MVCYLYLIKLIRNPDEGILATKLEKMLMISLFFISVLQHQLVLLKATGVYRDACTLNSMDLSNAGPKKKKAWTLFEKSSSFRYLISEIIMFFLPGSKIN